MQFCWPNWCPNTAQEGGHARVLSVQTGGVQEAHVARVGPGARRPRPVGAAVSGGGAPRAQVPDGIDVAAVDAGVGVGAGLCRFPVETPEVPLGEEGGVQEVFSTWLRHGPRSNRSPPSVGTPLIAWGSHSIPQHGRPRVRGDAPPCPETELKKRFHGVHKRERVRAS